MNYCRKCQSDYEKPGTCNCYAGTQPMKPVQPFFPYSPWERPIYPSPTVKPWSPYEYDTTCGTVQVTVDPTGVMRDHGGNEIQGSFT